VDSDWACAAGVVLRRMRDGFQSYGSLRGIVEIVGLMGQYTGLTMLFVVDRYPVPAGAPDEVNRPM